MSVRQLESLHRFVPVTAADFPSVGAKKHVGRSGAARGKFAFRFQPGDWWRVRRGAADGGRDHLDLLLIFLAVSERRFPHEQISRKVAVARPPNRSSAL